MDIRNVKSSEDLVRYFIQNLNWNIDEDDFDEIDDISYDFDADDLGLKREEFSKINSLKQLQQISDNQKWGIFCVEFESKRFEVSALRKILSRFIPKKRNSADHAVWDQNDLLFLCFWGKDNNRTIGIAHFDDKGQGLPQIRMISCEPAIEERFNIANFESRLSRLRWVDDENDTEKWYEQWSSAFVSGYREVIRSSHELTKKMANKAREIRDQILRIYAVENERGYVHKLFKDFKNSLIHDLSEKQFADMYAQTVVYGLFSAKCMDTTHDDFDARKAVNCLPNTNPFLRRLMRDCLGEGNRKMLTFDELEVSDIVDLLRHTDTELIVNDFNRMTGGGREDPVIHFYEEFLNEYDGEQKKRRGVYYTPQPVVNFIVRAVDDILKNEFGLADGLASEETKEIMVEVEGKKRRERQTVPAVQILDPATGTGTFLRQTILRIYDNFCEKHKGESAEQIKAAWNEYVPKHLLPRLNGFELMMAPYAVAHMKLAMVLKDTGYDFGSNERLNVFLTNSLEEPGNSDIQLSLYTDDPLANESVEANQAKKNNGINVIIGNPPYSGSSANKGEWINSLIDDFRYEPGRRVRLKEIKTHLDNDYIKFIRYANYILDRGENGVIAFITPRDYIFSPTFRGFRWIMQSIYEKIYIIDLHGDSRQNRNSQDKDENVFDIQQGVCIGVFIKKRNLSKAQGTIKHYGIRGFRDDKFHFLNSKNISNINYTLVNNCFPNYFYEPITVENYEKSFSISDLFKYSVNGIQTGRDVIAIQPSAEKMQYVLADFISLDSESARLKYNIGSDGRDWKIEWAQEDVKHNIKSKTNITPILYRPFDIRYTFYTGPKGKGFLQCPRGEIMKNMVSTDNIALIIGRQGQAVGNIEWCLAFLSHKMPTDLNIFYRGGGMVFPLYSYSSFQGEKIVLSNINSNLANKISKSINLSYSEKNDVKEVNSVTDLDIFQYVYAILYSHIYRKKYHELLLKDFPRVPYPTDQETFWKLVEIGSKLRECHLMHTQFDTEPYSFIGDGTNEVVKPEYKNGRVYISKTQYFDNVPQAQWEQYIGGYQPLQKWLKDRKKMTLSPEDIEHYKKIIAALKLTEELMAQIDEIVEF